MSLCCGGVGRVPPHFQASTLLSGPQVMWTDLPCQNFHLLVCCAILDSEKQKIMEENYGFNEILKVILRCRRLPHPSSPNTPVQDKGLEC